jgi:hypothetical protein
MPRSSRLLKMKALPSFGGNRPEHKQDLTAAIFGLLWWEKVLAQR